tara:strand:+ start:1313 stop:1708 length:396 start_codon:yes stop_codon:yes gene_type:complete
MTLLVANASEAIMLENFLNKSASQDLVFRLYSNDVTPAEADVVGTYTEVVGGGYSSTAITAANWTVTPGNPTAADYPLIATVFTGTFGNVYGYFITQATSGALMWAERFDTTINIQNPSDTINVTLNITLE